MFKLQLIWRRLHGKLWFRPTFWSVAAVAAALMAALANHLPLPAGMPNIGQSALEGLLTIIASSMLTVSTFSLSILVSAFASAASSATPRATRLVMADDSAQHAISAFIASFIFAMVALTALGLGYYGDTGRFVLLGFTIYVLGYLILALLRWIDTLSKLGRMSHTIKTVENAALPPLRAWFAEPALGARTDAPDSAPSGVRVHGVRSGWLQYIDLASLQRIAAEHETLIHVRVRPGDYVAPSSVLAVIEGRGAPDAGTLEDLAKAFLVGRDRTQDQDPRFGLVILSEIAQRALSPAVNDPGTAVMVTGVLTRLLIDGSHLPPGEEKPVARFERVTLVPVDEEALLRHVFEPIARDGAHMLEVALALQTALALLADNTYETLREAALAEALAAKDHALQGLKLQRERDALAEWKYKPEA
ncbi:hypothetical protein LPB72_21180 [Hydrogenophaga crassostreae]|uniref:DUF2254 domain-containing protein n=1 Tax=Hydrogenophaga crassostreae TaxID=1763535 RepID=A0A162YQR9_9BURK|nr:DUF2254 domain-containing protein [Hydrogenophaga crassostreae]AOW15048.1 hypothetical protein LPB072_21795 [Hydrogenophaga crassostreae]OAD39500.1 hypothetical protein LPB72_21180 [Hydrogenophaga crassostreae]